MGMKIEAGAGHLHAYLINETQEFWVGVQFYTEIITGCSILGALMVKTKMVI